MKPDSVARAPEVVLWEDDPVRRPLLTAILEGSGLAVTAPALAGVALERAAGGGCRRLVLDANVSRPSGTEFLRELHHRLAGHLPPTLALMQPGQASLRAAVRELGVARILHEPFEPDELVAAVRSLARPDERAA